MQVLSDHVAWRPNIYSCQSLCIQLTNLHVESHYALSQLTSQLFINTQQFGIFYLDIIFKEYKELDGMQVNFDLIEVLLEIFKRTRSFIDFFSWMSILRGTGWYIILSTRGTFSTCEWSQLTLFLFLYNV